MARGKIKYRPQHGEDIMYDPKLEDAMQDIVSGIQSRAEAGGGVYGAIVENGGDRLRGAVWTQDHKAIRRTARDGTLLASLRGGGV